MKERPLLPLFEAMQSPHIAVVGDFMLDRFIWGKATRVSPEAPVPVVLAQQEECRPGGAGNVVANLLSLGAKVACFGVIGDDDSGRQLQTILQELGADVSGLICCPHRPTVEKTRVMAQNQQMVRVDRESSAQLDQQTQSEILAALENANWDAVVVSDYAKGVMDPISAAVVLDLAKQRELPSIVDPKHLRGADCRGASVVTPNRQEAELWAGKSLVDLPALQAWAPTAIRETGLSALLVTLGADGMLLCEKDQVVHLPTAARQVFDVTGAGDTVVAMLAYALAEKTPLETATYLANVAAGLAVAKVGTATVSKAEVAAQLASANPGQKTIFTAQPEALGLALAEFKKKANRLVFTNGCFDILHAGHVRYLSQSRQLGDALIVGLNTDASVRRLKGDERPINSEEDRAFVLAALECVDLVVLFADDTPASLIEQVKPQVLVKGGDWREEDVVGAEFVRAQGGKVCILDLLPGRSTTSVVERIRQR
jgi:D-beta-D-heptose 7-phosphate kinase/D-beta-D-heptose 1-phosphate adenosyltransferase